jgi:hypothetical protein
VKLITTALIFLLFAIPVYPQWVQQDSTTDADLNELFCITEDTVIVVGNNGTILKTTDGGAQWYIKNSGTTANLTKVQFSTPDKGYAVGMNGTLIKTTNGGEDWQTIDIGEITDLYGLSLLDENQFYISGDNGLLKKTIDGGTTFLAANALLSEDIREVQFLNPLIGYAQGGKLLKTVDGGVTWSVITQDFVGSFYFVNEDVGFINTINSGLLKTSDGGINMISLAGSAFYISDLFALDENEIWAVENDAPLCSCPGFCIIKGEIIAEEYQDVYNCDLAGGFEGIYFATETKGYAVGYGGAIFKNSTGNMLGINENTQDDLFIIYPNPASSYISLSFAGNISQLVSIDISDIIGKKVYSQLHSAANDTTINISALAKGTYFLMVTSDSKRTSGKLIID